jgi:hypothetical protein
MNGKKRERKCEISVWVVCGIMLNFQIIFMCFIYLTMMCEVLIKCLKALLDAIVKYMRESILDVFADELLLLFFHTSWSSRNVLLLKQTYFFSPYIYKINFLFIFLFCTSLFLNFFFILQFFGFEI